MIPIPRDYDSARGFDGSNGPQLTPGGHICRIQAVRVEQSRSGKDMLVVAFDIAENGEFDGYYKARYDRARGFDANAKWPGVFRVTLLNSEGKTNGFFKGFIEAVEGSNSNYNFKATNGDEQSLRGKLVGFNFGEEEYCQQSTGEIKTSVKPSYAVSVARVREGVIPPAKKLYKSQDNPFAASAPLPAPSNEQMRMTGFTPVDDDELPF